MNIDPNLVRAHLKAAGLSITSAGRIIGSAEQLIRFAELLSPDAQLAANRYEYVRRLNPRQYGELWDRNINGEGSFDALVDAAMARDLPPPPADEGR